MNSLLCRSVAALLALCVVCSASFSVYITQKGSSARVVQPEGRPLVFRTEAPTAEHVADIYARTTGRPPLLSEDSANLPVLEATSSASESTSTSALLVEVKTDAALDMSDDSDILTLAMCEDVISVGPSLDSVLAVLTASGISAKTLSMPQQSSEDLTAFLRAQHVPVFVLHHYDANSDRGLMELQSNGSDTTSTTPVPLTEAQIAQYQIALWTAVGMVLMILTAVCMVAGMEVIPDSLLFAKFQSTRANKTD